MADPTRRVLLHVGTHKTGTTSIQHFLRTQDEPLLAAWGCHYPAGFLVPSVHTELPLVTIRPERTWPARIRFPETSSASWAAAAHEHVRHQVDTDPHERLVYIHEDLSYLRHPDELERLASMLEGRRVDVVVVLREPSAFLRSYRAQMEHDGFPPSTDPSSFAYTEPDSWLVDYDSLVEGYRGTFGADRVTVLDYDELERIDGTVIPRVADLLGIPRAELPPLEEYRLNQTGYQAGFRLPEAQRSAIRADIARRYP